MQFQDEVLCNVYLGRDAVQGLVADSLFSDPQRGPAGGAVERLQHDLRGGRGSAIRTSYISCDFDDVDPRVR